MAIAVRWPIWTAAVAWAWVTLPSFGDLPAGFVRTLLSRRSLDDLADIAYYCAFTPPP
ncbi:MULTISPECIES: hypothetical protein [Nocardia]|uniref:hypothetical protein n=1 Tax=Nocardia TaxID=1817 RepID=UPI0012F489E1|nr:MULTISPECIES: hypothetical protein [Nocardia]